MIKRLFEVAIRFEKIMKLLDLSKQKFEVAAGNDDQKGMDIARNELHAVVDESMDLLYEMAKLSKESEEEMLRDLENK